MTNEMSAEQMESVVLRLSEPFDVTEIQWVVKSTTKDGQHALVAPYADPRAYYRRLDEAVTPAGWSNEYKTQLVSGLTRTINGTLVPSGKVFVVCSLTIAGLGTTKSATGEMWADDDNAVTRAEAQAFKRACAMFGLGAYLYRIKHGVDGVRLWVPYDAQSRQIVEIPHLPDWAISACDREARKPVRSETTAQPAAATVPVAASSNSGSAPAATMTVDYEEELGAPLYASIVQEVNRLVKEQKVRADRATVLARALEKMRTLLESVRTVASEMPIGALDAALNRCGVTRLDLIPNYTVLRQLARDLFDGEQAAA